MLLCPAAPAGLGKTIQTASYLAALYHEGVTRPALVVVPLSTLRNWERELAAWAPYLNVVTLIGGQDSRKLIKQHEMYTQAEVRRRPAELKAMSSRCVYTVAKFDHRRHFVGVQACGSGIKMGQKACAILQRCHVQLLGSCHRRVWIGSAFLHQFDWTASS